MLTTHHLPVLSLRMSGAKPLLLLHAFMTCTGTLPLLFFGNTTIY